MHMYVQATAKLVDHRLRIERRMSGLAVPHNLVMFKASHLFRQYVNSSVPLNEWHVIHKRDT